jgi:hypothetical protein
MRAGIATLAGVGLLLAAFGLASTTPSDDVLQAPFAATGEVGDEIVSRSLVLTVHRVGLAREISVDGAEGTTAGVWLVVEATLAATRERTTVDADVLIDGVRYTASGRFSTETLADRVADVDLPTTGAIVIELPAGVRDLSGAAAAVLRVSASTDARLDSVAELPLDLTALEVEDLTQVDGVRDGPR